MSGRVGEWCLKVPYQEHPIRLQPSMIFVGRQECDILVNSTTVDKRHAVIYFNATDQQFHIKDLNTLSGTYVNGVRIPEQSYIKLEHGDQIRFGYHKQAYEITLSADDRALHALKSPTTPLDDDDSLNSVQQKASPSKGTDSLEDVSPCVVTHRQLRELYKNHSVPTIGEKESNDSRSQDTTHGISPTSTSSAVKGNCTVPRPDLPLTKHHSNSMVNSYCAPVKSPSESLIDSRMICSLWDRQSPQSPSPQQPPPIPRSRPSSSSRMGSLERSSPTRVTSNSTLCQNLTQNDLNSSPNSQNKNDYDPHGHNFQGEDDGGAHNMNITSPPSRPQRPPPPMAMVIPLNSEATSSPKKCSEKGDESVVSNNAVDGVNTTTNRKEMSKAFVINFDEPKRRASVPQSVLQRREAQKANNNSHNIDKQSDECRATLSEDSNETTLNTNSINGNLSDSANFLIQKMLQSEQAESAADAQDQEEEKRSETGTYTVEDPQAREARRKIDQVFGVTDEAFNEYNLRNSAGNTRTFTRSKPQPPTQISHGNVARTPPVVAPSRRRTASSSTYLASSAPTNHGIPDPMISSTISSGSSNGGLPSKPAVVRAKAATPVRSTPTTACASTNVKSRRPSSSGTARSSSINKTNASGKSNDGRPMTAKTTVTSTLRRGPYGGSDFSLESSNSSGSHLTGGTDSMKVNRAFALRRARLGLAEPVSQQKAHLLTGSNPSLFSRQDGGRFSMRLPSSRSTNRMNPRQSLVSSISSASTAGITETNSNSPSPTATPLPTPVGRAGRVKDKSPHSPRVYRRNDSDPCNINFMGQDSDENDELLRLDPQQPDTMVMHPSNVCPLLIQSMMEPSSLRSSSSASNQSSQHQHSNPSKALINQEASMSRSASFNSSHHYEPPPSNTPPTSSQSKRSCASPLLQRKETFLKNSPIHSFSEDRARCVSTTPTKGTPTSTHPPASSRSSFSPRLQRKSQSPQVGRKVFPVSCSLQNGFGNASMHSSCSSAYGSPAKGVHNVSSKPPPCGSAVHSPNSSDRETKNGTTLTALDTLVIQAITQLSGKLRLTARSLLAREGQRYPEGSAASLTIQEFLSSSQGTPNQVTPGDTSKELAAILRNLRNLDHSMSILNALEPPPLPVDMEVAVGPSSASEGTEAEDAKDSTELGDKVPRGFFMVSL